MAWQLPEQNIYEEPLACIAINTGWLKIVSGSLQDLLDGGNWVEMSRDDYLRMQDNITTLIALFATIQECGVTCFQFRNNPNNPGCIQMSCDGGATWADAFCGVNPLMGAMTRYGPTGHLQSSFDGGITWGDSDASDPRFNSPAPTGHIGTDATCRAAENIRDQYKFIKTEVANALAIGGAITGIIAAIVGVVETLVGFPVPPQVVFALAATITGLIVAEWNAIMSDEVFEAFKCIVDCALADNIPPTPTRFGSLDYDYIFARCETDFDLIPRLFFQAITAINGPVGLQIQSVLGNNDGATCGGCECPECAFALEDLSGDLALTDLGNCRYHVTLPANMLDFAEIKRIDSQCFRLGDGAWTDPNWTAHYKDCFTGEWINWAFLGYSTNMIAHRFLNVNNFAIGVSFTIVDHE